MWQPLLRLPRVVVLCRRATLVAREAIAWQPVAVDSVPQRLVGGAVG
jgi:hypothetical protein